MLISLFTLTVYQTKINLTPNGIMKLEEQFINEFTDLALTKNLCEDFLIISKKCVEIANAHALGFSKWKDRNTTFSSNAFYWHFDSERDLTLEQLLEIYNNINP